MAEKLSDLDKQNILIGEFQRRKDEGAYAEETHITGGTTHELDVTDGSSAHILEIRRRASERVFNTVVYLYTPEDRKDLQVRAEIAGSRNPISFPDDSAATVLPLVVQVNFFRGAKCSIDQAPWQVNESGVYSTEFSFQAEPGQLLLSRGDDIGIVIGFPVDGRVSVCVRAKYLTRFTPYSVTDAEYKRLEEKMQHRKKLESFSSRLSGSYTICKGGRSTYLDRLESPDIATRIKEFSALIKEALQFFERYRDVFSSGDWSLMNHLADFVHFAGFELPSECSFELSQEWDDAISQCRGR